ncbi:lytic polysaccharide monooxygenase [Atractiella rhizophila]|nr:lytic polysaccharide monooxygenase [Atractiella rhizophila]
MLAYASLLALFSAASAHMVIRSPVPYGQSTLDNSPLLADGSNFPCKRLYTEGDAARAQNVFPAGSSQTLAFKGSAVHGGGSCQLALTTEAEPTVDTVWQVIHSFEGNCPSNVTGNLDADPNGLGATVFSYDIPESIPSGDYTLAWTWFNKIGNREMYMNCAPITVTGGGKGDESFPDIFKANIGNGCTTVDSQNVKFPNPGAYTDVLADTVDPVGTCETPKTSTPTPAPGSGGDDAPATSSSPEVISSSSSSSAPVKTVSTSAIATVSSAPGKNNPAPTTSSSSSAPSVTSSPSTGSGKVLTGACEPEGLYNCLGNAFQRCASGQWSVSMSLAAGMKCTGGESSELTLKTTDAKKVRRSAHKGKRAKSLRMRY